MGLIAASVILLGFTQGRAGCIGLAIAIAYIACQYLTATSFKRVVLFMTLPAIVLLTAAIVLFKSDSSSGRLLIYKVSAGMLKENWLWGIGHGQFKIQYNQYQAAYFAAHNIDSKEALLADNTFYAFNDLLQAVIENGIIALLFLAAILFLLVWQIKKAKTNTDNKHLFTASVASLLCVLTGALFSYPLQILPIAVQATLCLCIINSFETEKKFQFELFEVGWKIAGSMLILLSALLLIHYSFYFNHKRESNQAFELKRTGFRQMAIEKYKHLNSSYIQEGNMLYLYAQELYNINQLSMARETLSRAKKFYCTNEVFKLSAAIESELKNYKQAEADYKTAINMVPNRMASRSELFEFYLERKDTASAIYWANSILKMPVKIASQKTKNIRQRTKEILNGLIN
ncbi:MAG: O-antigen ligase family protein [Chitinophagaceae bacterium]|nr:O-antigen ligase family protein [Chitinophagaceae bacterium]